RRGLLRERAFEREEIGEGRGRRVPDGRVALERAVLVHERDPQPREPAHGSVRRLELAGDHPEERRLPRFVPADDTPALAFADREGHVQEARRAAEVYGDGAEGDQTHPSRLTP